MNIRFQNWRGVFWAFLFGLFVVACAADIPPSNPSTAEDYVKSGIAKEKSGDLCGAIADYRTATELDRNDMDAYARGNNASMAVNKQVAAAEAKACEQDPKFAAAYPNPTPAAGYDFITVQYSAHVPDKDSQTQVIQRHRFVDGKFVKTELIYQITEFGKPGIQMNASDKPIIWKDRYLVSDLGLSMLDLWTGKMKSLDHDSPPPNHVFIVLSASPNELIVENVHTTPKDTATGIAEAKAKNNLFRLIEPNGRLEPLPKAEIPPWPNQFPPFGLPHYWEISPDGNRRAMQPLPGDNPAPEDGMWLYDRTNGEVKFLAGSFSDPSKVHAYVPSMVWLDNGRFITSRPDGEIILVQWDGSVTSLGRVPEFDPANKSPIFFVRDGMGRILFSNSNQGSYFLLDVESKTVTKAETWKLGHDWEINLPLSFTTPLELRHAGQLIVKTISPGIPSVSPDGLNVAMHDYDKLQNQDAFQKGYLRVYSLVTKEWVDFPSDERPVAWIPAAPDAK